MAGWIGVALTRDGFSFLDRPQLTWYFDERIAHRYSVSEWRSWILTVTSVGPGGIDDPTSPNVVSGPVPGWIMAAIESHPEHTERAEIGWPSRIVRIEYTFDDPHLYRDHPAMHGIHWIGVVPIATRPLFPGILFLIATVYALLLAIEQALRIPCNMRTRRRRKRGLCDRCGYDLAGVTIDVCPECGVGTHPMPTLNRFESVGALSGKELAEAKPVELEPRLLVAGDE